MESAQVLQQYYRGNRTRLIFLKTHDATREPYDVTLQNPFVQGMFNVYMQILLRRLQRISKHLHNQGVGIAIRHKFHIRDFADKVVNLIYVAFNISEQLIRIQGLGSRRIMLSILSRRLKDHRRGCRNRPFRHPGKETPKQGTENQYSHYSAIHGLASGFSLLANLPSDFLLRLVLHYHMGGELRSLPTALRVCTRLICVQQPNRFPSPGCSGQHSTVRPGILFRSPILSNQICGPCLRHSTDPGGGVRVQDGSSLRPGPRRTGPPMACFMVGTSSSCSCQNPVPGQVRRNRTRRFYRPSRRPGGRCHSGRRSPRPPGPGE